MISIFHSQTPLKDTNIGIFSLIRWLENVINSSKSIKELEREYKRTQKKPGKTKTKPHINVEKHEAIQEAVQLAQKGFDRKYICNILSIKPNSLKWALHKITHNIVVSPQKKGRKTLLQMKYLNRVSEILESSIPNKVINLETY